MLKPAMPSRRLAAGVTLIEVLVSIVILSFGLLGLANLQAKLHVAEVEAFQRTQAILALSDISERISANRTQAASYVSAGLIGAGDSQPASCTGLAMGAARDLCEWSNTLKGRAEGATNAFGGRGCITEVQAPVAVSPCKPGVYQVTVTWQGMVKSSTPALSCAASSYGDDDGYRRAISGQVTVGVPAC
jgi:type IV pilus assembly protein PilV